MVKASLYVFLELCLEFQWFICSGMQHSDKNIFPQMVLSLVDFLHMYDIQFICSYQFSNVWHTIDGVSYTNNGIVTIIDIGTDSATLNCTTTSFLSVRK